jgi:hypothetical protein
MTRRKKFAATLAVVGMLLGPAAQAAETVMYCTTELSTGMKFKKGGWKTVKFKKDRYTIKFSENYDSVVGLDGKTIWQCERIWSNIKPELISCNGRYGHLNFNKKTNRFTLSRTYGWIHQRPGEADADTVSVENGTCQNF